MRIALFLFMVLQGLVNALGFVKAFDLFPVDALGLAIAGPVGLLWLLAALLLLIGAFLYLRRRDAWWMFALPGIAVSQGVIIAAWTDTKFVSILNLVILVVVLPSLADLLPGSLPSTFRRSAEELPRTAAEAPLLTEADLAGLPAPVASYVRYSGAVGLPRVRSVRATLAGRMKRQPGGPWQAFSAELHDAFDEPFRLSLTRSDTLGLPFDTLAELRAGAARVTSRLTSLIRVADATGPDLQHDEAANLLADLCRLAPAALVDPRVTWEAANGPAAKATFSTGAVTVRAGLTFVDAGRLVALTSDGGSPAWFMKLREYRDFGGRQIAAVSETSWRTPEGDVPSARSVLRDLTLDAGRR